MYKNAPGVVIGGSAIIFKLVVQRNMDIEARNRGMDICGCFFELEGYRTALLVLSRDINAVGMHLPSYI